MNFREQFGTNLLSRRFNSDPRLQFIDNNL